jgi:hypothetical protein
MKAGSLTLGCQGARLAKPMSCVRRSKQYLQIVLRVVTACLLQQAHLSRRQPTASKPDVVKGGALVDAHGRGFTAAADVLPGLLHWDGEFASVHCMCMTFQTSVGMVVC